MQGYPTLEAFAERKKKICVDVELIRSHFKTSSQAQSSAVAFGYGGISFVGSIWSILEIPLEAGLLWLTTSIRLASSL
jgi:hypothetical protein